MTKKFWLLLSASWIISLCGAFTLGRLHARGWVWADPDRSVDLSEFMPKPGLTAQVECLKGVWGKPFTLSQLQQVRTLSQDPEALRSLLLDWVKRDLSSMDVDLTGFMGEGYVPTPSDNERKRKREKLERTQVRLESWVPGQTSFTDPQPIMKGNK